MSDKHDNRTHLYYDHGIVYLGAMLYVGYRCSRTTMIRPIFYLGGVSSDILTDGNERQSLRYEQLKLQWASGLAYRQVCPTRMDCHRTRHRNVHKLEDRSKTDPPLHSRSRQFDHASFFFGNRYRDQRRSSIYRGAILSLYFHTVRSLPDSPHAENCFSSLFGVNYVAAIVISAIVIVELYGLADSCRPQQPDFIQVLSLCLLP